MANILFETILNNIGKIKLFFDKICRNYMNLFYVRLLLTEGIFIECQR